MIDHVERRALSLLLAVLMVFSLLPVQAYAAKTVTFENITITSGGNGNNIDIVEGSNDAGKTITATAAYITGSSCQGLKPVTTYTGSNITLTIKNGYSNPAILTFSYETENVKSVTVDNTTYTTASGNVTVALPANGTIAFKFTGVDQPLDGKATLSKFSLVERISKTLTFGEAANGSYTVDGEAVTAGTSKTVYTTDPVTLAATANEGYEFAGWYNETTGKALSMEPSTSILVSEDMTIAPRFVVAIDNPVYSIGSVKFATLADALNASNSGDVVVQLRDDTLPAGEYTIPSGVTLLIPCDDAATVYTNTDIDKKSAMSGGNAAQDTPYVFRTLTMEDGAKLTVNGNLNVSAMHSPCQGSYIPGNRPNGPYGRIVMEGSSTIDIKSAANLYAWGYIIGSGQVTAYSGGTIYEMMQITDFKGGTASTRALNNKNGTFLFSQYYVQNIEVLTTIHTGAALKTAASAVLRSGNNSAVVDFIGSSGSMFVLGSNTYVTKDYDELRDRMVVSSSGEVSLSPITMSLGSLTVKSDNYKLPINSNITINISGKATVNQDMEFLPGAELTLAEDSTITVPEGIDVYIHNAEKWNEKNYVYLATGFAKHGPLTYIGSTQAKSTREAPGDAILDLNGTLKVAGNVTVARGHSQIISSKGTGRIEYSAAPKNGAVYAITVLAAGLSDNTFTKVADTVPVQLTNADGTYTSTADAKDGDYYVYNEAEEKWLKNGLHQYIVTYNPNGGEGAEYTQNLAYSDETGGTLTANTFTKTGYTFAGWAKSADGEKVYEDKATVTDLTGDIKLYAKWNINKYTLTWSIDGKSTEEQKEYNASVSKPADPTKEGYVFAGWKDQDGKDVTFPYTMPTKNVTLTAQFKRINNITFNANGGTGEMAGQTVNEGATAALAANSFTRAGYTFAGWATSANGEKTYDNQASITGGAEDVTLYALWTANTGTAYKVEIYTMGVDGQYGTPTVENKAGTTDVTATYEPAAAAEGFTLDSEASTLKGNIFGDGSLVLKVYYKRNQYTFKTVVDGEETEATYYYGAAVTEPADPAKNGYVFAGWDGEIPATMPAKDVTLTAQFKRINAITFNANGGTGEMAGQTVNEGATAALAANSFTRAGYTFAGWATSANGEKAYDNQASITGGTADVTLYALWTANTDTAYKVEIYTMGVDGQYGTPTVENKAGTTDVTATYEPAAAAEGFTLDSEASTLKGNISGDGSLVLKVYYKRNQYTFKTVVDGEETEATYYYGAAVTKPADPAKNGYVFAGWDGEIPATMPAEDVTLTARFKRINAITFNANGGTGEMAGQTVNEGATAALAANSFTRAGYTFAGWATSANGEKAYDNQASITGGAADVTLYALWTANTGTAYKVEIYTMGVDGQYGTPTVENKAGTTDTEAVYEPAAETGFVVDNTKSVLKGNISGDGSLVLKVYYKRNQYTFKTVVDGEETEATYYYGAAVTKPADPAKNGYVFAGWDGEIPATMPDKDVTLTAQFKRINAITFNANGGTGEMAGQTVNEGAAAALAANSFTRAGYTFAGWATSANGEKAYDNQASITGGTADVTLYALWRANTDTAYKVELYTMGVDGQYGAPTVENKTGTTDTEAVYEPAAETGFAVDNTKSVLKGNISGDGSLVLKVYYKRNQYTFKTVVDGEATDTVYYYGAAVTRPADPAKNGYVFAGWDGEIPATMPAEDVILVAEWTKMRYTITWIVDGQEIAESYEYGATPSFKGNTDKAADAQYTYRFAGWDKEVATVTGTATYTAQYSTEVNTYAVTWIVDGEETTETYAYGAIPSFKGNTDKAADAQYTYYFASWDQEVVAVTGTATYTAEYTTEVNNYVVTWVVDGEETTETYAYGATPSFKGSADKAADAQYTYRFAGWDQEVVAVTGTVTYTAVFDQVTNSYTITWVHPDDGVLETDENVLYGTVPTYDGQTPAKAANEVTSYVFMGWYPGVSAVVGDATYTARFAEHINLYTVTFQLDGGTIDLSTEDVQIYEEYGTQFQVPAPVKANNQFMGWVKVTTDEEGNEVLTPVDSIPNTITAENITYRAQWKKDQYTIIFDYNGGSFSGESSGTFTKDHGTDVIPNQPTFEGHTFCGWAETADGAVKYTPGQKIRIQNTTLYAVWTINQYTLTYDSKGGTLVNGGTYDYNTAITVAEAPVKEGHSFVGWALVDSNRAEDVKYAADDSIYLTKDTTLYAVWTELEYGYKFVADDRIISEGVVAYGKAIPVPADPQKTGYTFREWSPDIPAAMPAEDMTFTALWNINKYTITWKYMDENGEETESVVEVSYQDMPEHEVPESYQTLTHTYTFRNWSPEVSAAEDHTTYTAEYDKTSRLYDVHWVVNGNTTTTAVAYGNMPTAPTVEDYQDKVNQYTFQRWDAEIMEVTGEVTYTAVFHAEPIVYTVSFNAGEGATFGEETGQIYSVTGGYDQKVTAPAAPEKTGYRFMGWDVTVPETFTDNVELHAQWEVMQYSITFMDGDTEIGVITADYHAAIDPEAIPALPGKTGYSSKWDQAVPETMPVNGLTIRAVHTINQYTIVFANTGDTEIASITQDYGTAVQAPADPEKKGHTFAGWDMKIPTTMPADNMAISANWIVNSYSITFMADNEELKTINQEFEAEIDPTEIPVAEKTGYTFAGWIIRNAEGQDVTYTVPAKMPAENVVVYADWTVDTFKINFLVDENATESVASVDVDFDTEFTPEIVEAILAQVPEEPEKEGHEFLGWNVDALTGTMPANAVNVYANWKINQYTITFADTDFEAVTQDYGTEVSAPGIPVKEGHTFAGWDKQIPEIMPAEDVTVTARWTVNQYTIHFETDGGTEIAAITQDYGTEITTPEDPVKQDYLFVGWDQEIPKTMPAEDVTLRAIWVNSTYTVYWDVDGDGETDELSTVNYLAAPQHVDGAKSPTKEYSFRFKGWNTAADGTGEWLTQEVQTTSELTYYAQFDTVPNVYTITFDADNGSAAEVQEYAYGAQIENPEDPVKEGYTFTGWAPALQDTMPAEHLMVVAQWTPVKYTITFDANGGNAVTEITAGYEMAISKPADPVREGYTFKGWSADGMSVMEEFPATMPLNGMKLKALWSPNKYTIIFVDGFGGTIATITQDYGTVITAPENPSKVDYAFRNWDVQVPATMPVTAETGMVITAQWKYIYTGWKTDDTGTTYLVNGEKAYFEKMATIAEKTYYFDAAGYLVKGIQKVEDKAYAFDTTDGSWLNNYTGVFTNTDHSCYYVKNGIVQTDVGLYRQVQVNGDVQYYYFCNGTSCNLEGCAQGGVAVRSGVHWIELNNGLLPKWDYTFDDNSIIVHEDDCRTGIHKDASGTECYYIDGIKVNFGLFLGDGVIGVEGKYYYARSNGSLIKGRTYWITNTNGLLPEGSYDFDENGWIILAPEMKNGVVKENGKLHYYVDGTQIKDAGLIREDQKDGDIHYYYFCDGTNCNMEGCPQDGSGVINGRHWIERNNNLLSKWDYTFDKDGVIVHEADCRTGLHQDDTGAEFYYIDGIKVNKGMFLGDGIIGVEGKYYYARSSGMLVKNQSYWASNNNGLLPEGLYEFDENGWMVNVPEIKNGVVEENGKLYYYVNSVLIKDAGLIREVQKDGDIHYYYFCDGTNCNMAGCPQDGSGVVSGRHWIERNNNMLAKWDYTFDAEGVIVHEDNCQTGLYEDEAGVECYYVDGIKVNKGLFLGDGTIGVEGKYYYARSSGALVKNQDYWVSNTNGLVREGSYTFDENGWIINPIVIEPEEPTEPEEPDDPKVKNGIYEENGKLYYYVNNLKYYAGLFELDGEYYYARSSGELARNCSYWPTKTNGLMVTTRQHTFDEMGRMVDLPEEFQKPVEPDTPVVPDVPVDPDPPVETPDEPEIPAVKNGIVDEEGKRYYYVDGVRTYAGLIYLEGYYYYVRTSGELACSCKYWPTKTNDLMVITRQHTFDEQGRMIDPIG